MLKINNLNVIILVISILFIINFQLIVNNLQIDYLGILLAFALFFYSAKVTNIRYDYYVFIFIVLLQYISYQLHINSFHFLSLELLLVLTYFIITKKFSWIAFLCILIYSTLFSKIFDGFSVQIKQEICKLVYLSLKYVIQIDNYEGVNFYINQVKISIDTACVGLNLFKTGILLGCGFILFEEKRQQKNFSNLQLFFILIIILLLNIISNYFRIITLVVFQCIENNLLHQLIGYFSFVIYQVIPSIFVIKYLIKPNYLQDKFSIKTNYIFIYTISIVVLVTSFEMKNEKEYNLLHNLPKNYQNGKWIIKNEVYQKINQDTIIYVKAPFHNPMVCWTGSGYEIFSQKKILKNNHQQIKIVMIKNKKIFHSYYWFEVNNCKETSFIKANVESLISKQPIRLINETFHYSK